MRAAVFFARGAENPQNALSYLSVGSDCHLAEFLCLLVELEKFATKLELELSLAGVKAFTVENLTQFSLSVELRRVLRKGRVVAQALEPV